MLLLQAALCFSSNGFAVLLAILLLRDARHYAGAWIGAALFLCSIGYSLTLLPPPLRLPDPLYGAAALANVPTLGLNLLFGRALLVDGFRFGWREGGALIALSVVMFLGARPLLGMADEAQSVIEPILAASSLIVMVHVLWLALSGFREDLVESRRRLRIVLVIFVLATYAVVSFVELRGMSNVAEGIAFDASTLAIALILLLWLTRLNAARLFADSKPVEKVTPRSSLGTPPARQAEKQKLLELLNEDEAWRDDELTIGSLAGRLGIAEHQLRALINREMGHKNFSTFINGYRLAAAKKSLGDPAEARIPILTIAMDSGFRSLSTFNRSFKLQEGLTPSSYRERFLSAADRLDS